MSYLTQEKVLTHIPTQCKFRLSALNLNTHVMNGNIRVKRDGDNLLYCWEDCVKTFSNPQNKVNDKTKIKYSVCNRLNIDPLTFEDEEDPLTEEELREWGEKNLK